MDVFSIYQELYKKYGPQYWWPRHRGKKRPGFDPRFEIIIGAILTQNTAWKNVEKAIECLFEKNLLDAEAVATVPIRRLEACIRSSGYYRQKTKKLKIIARFFLEQKKLFANRRRSAFVCGRDVPTHGQLLSLWGIGRETADSILLYAFNKPIFVVDAYTRRLLVAYRQKNLAEADYEKIKMFFEKQLPSDYKLFNEFHALIVRWGKEVGSKKIG